MSILIDDFEIDASLEEDHLLESEVTDYPLESGGVATDGIRKLPRKIVVKGIVSDTPIGLIVQRRALTEGLPTDDALVWLEDIYERGEPVRIETSLKIYDSVAMESLQIPRTADNGDTLVFTATFKVITIKTSARSTVRVAVPEHRKKVNRGTKPSTPVTEETAQQTQTNDFVRTYAETGDQLVDLMNSPISNQSLGAPFNNF